MRSFVHVALLVRVGSFESDSECDDEVDVDGLNDAEKSTVDDGVTVPLTSLVHDADVEDDGNGLSDSLGVWDRVKLRPSEGVSPGRKNFFDSVGDTDRDGRERLPSVRDSESVTVPVDVSERLYVNVGVTEAERSPEGLLVVLADCEIEYVQLGEDVTLRETLRVGGGEAVFVRSAVSVGVAVFEVSEVPDVD